MSFTEIIKLADIATPKNLKETLNNIVKHTTNNYQPKTDNNLETINKEIVKAINESYHLGWNAYSRIFSLNIENLLSEGRGTGSIVTVKDVDKNTGNGRFGACFGTNNIMNADHSLICSIDSESVDGGQGSVFIAGGNNNKVAKGLASAIGHNLRVNTDAPNYWKPKIGMGLWNKDVANTVLLVGNGTSEEDRKNALEVYYDGHAEVQTQGTADNSVVIKSYLDSISLYKHLISFELFGRNNSTYKCKLVYLSNSNVAFKSGKAFYDEARNSGFVGSARDPNTINTAIVTLDNMHYVGDYYTICFDQNGGFLVDMNDIDGAGAISISNFTDTVL